MSPLAKRGQEEEEQSQAVQDGNEYKGDGVIDLANGCVPKGIENETIRIRLAGDSKSDLNNLPRASIGNESRVREWDLAG